MPRSTLGLSRSQKNKNKKESIITQPSQVVHHNHIIEQPGFFSNMWQGFGLGAGQAIAHNIFRSDPVVKVETISTHTTEIVKEYEKCLKDTYNDKEVCKEILERV